MPRPPYSLQPELQNNLVKATPLVPEDFDRLYAAANDPLIWEQHPNNNRWQREDFTNYFKGAIESGGAFLVSDAQTGEVIGSSRFSDWIPETSTISIGYTFFTRHCWGKGYNYALKTLMLDYIFQFAENVTFYVGVVNKRSQVSIERFGAQKIGEEEMAYFGEPSKLNFIYRITRKQWVSLKGSTGSFKTP